MISFTINLKFKQLNHSTNVDYNLNNLDINKN